MLEAEIATLDAGGWTDVWAPSAVPYNDLFAMPHEMTLEEIEEFKKAWKASVRRADQAGELADAAWQPRTSLTATTLSRCGCYRTSLCSWLPWALPC